MLTRILEPEYMDDPAEAAAYDAMDHREPNEAFVKRLLSLGARGRMLDLGTGPGDIPIMICQQQAGAHITAIDAAMSMLKIAAHKVHEEQLTHRIALQQADVKRLPFADGCFDVVFSNTILHHLPEPVTMLHEARRVLRQGGCLLIRDLYRPKDQTTLDALVAQHAGDCDDSQRRLFAESLRAALTPKELRQLADTAGLADATIVIDTDRHMSLMLPMR